MLHCLTGCPLLLTRRILPLPGGCKRCALQLLRHSSDTVVIVRPDFPQEPGGELAPAVLRKAFRIQQKQPLSRPRQRDVAQPALLFKSRLLAFLQRFTGRKNAFGQSQQEHHGELQPLGRMDRHQANGVTGCALALRRLQIQLGQESRQGQILPEAFFEFLRHALKFSQILQPFLVAQRADVCLIARLGANTPHDIRHAQGGRIVSQRPDNAGKFRRTSPAERIAHVRICQTGVQGTQQPAGTVVIGRIRRIDCAVPGSFCCQPFQQLQPPASQFAARHIDNAAEGVIVTGGNQAQIRHHIQHLHPAEKPDASDDLVGDVPLGQLLLHCPGQEAGAVQHCHIGIGVPAGVQLPDKRQHACRLVAIAFFMIVHDRFAGRRAGVEVFLEPHFVAVNQRVGAGQYLRRGAVVAIQKHSPAGRMRLVKIHQQADIRPAPLIDILVGVADDHQVSVSAGQKLHQMQLPPGAILKFVHLNVIQPLLPLAPYLCIGLQQVQGIIDQIVKVQSDDGFLPLEQFFQD